MAGQASVYKNALRLLGEPSNVGPDSDKKIVREMNGAYEDVVRRCFEKHPWNQFKSLQQLTQVTPAQPGWEYTFNVPAGFRRVVMVNNHPREDDIEGIPHGFRAGKIMTNSETTWLWFVDSTYEEQIGGWSQAFADYVSARLADEVWPINDEGDATRQRINAALASRLAEAIALDASGDPVVEQPEGRYVRGRTAGLSGRGRHRGY